MKTDLPSLMKKRQLDALFVYGDTSTCKDLAYLTAGIHLENALYLQRGSEAPLLYVSTIEREMAAKTGIEVHLWSEYDYRAYLTRNQNDRHAAWVALLTDLLSDHQVCGRVGFYGSADMGYAYRLLEDLSRQDLQLEIVGEGAPNIFSEARQTKSPDELGMMRDVARRTTEVVDSVIAYIQAHDVKETSLVRSDGLPLTIGDIKRHISLELAKRNLQETHENIFAQGRDAGVPHNTGQHDMALRIGEPIIFDLFPCDKSHGYFHDITRTFFIGHAPEEMAQRWHAVKSVFDTLMTAIEAGKPCSYYGHLACDLFEDMGYPTLRSTPGTQVGYAHSLGHGLGLEVHEDPGLSHLPGNDCILAPGHVITIEPGLYYPDDGWGIRHEDTVALDENGQVINLTNYPFTMVIPLT